MENKQIESSSSSSMPQIFINGIAGNVTSADIEKACEVACGSKPSTVTLRASQNHKLQNCLLTFSQKEQAETLLSKENLILADGTSLKLAKSQNIFPNLFMKNKESALTESELHEFIGSVVTGYYQIYFGNDQVSFFISNEAELKSLLNSQRVIKGKTCLFEKYSPSSPNKAKNQLYVRITCRPSEIMAKDAFKAKIESSYGPLSLFAQYDHKGESVLLNLIFQKEEDAQKFFTAIGTNGQSLFEYKNIKVSWTRNEEQEDTDDQKVVLKFLKNETTEHQIREALGPFGSILSLEVQIFNNNGAISKSAHIKMGSKDECTEIMVEAFKSKAIKNLFNNSKPYITPYISKGQVEAIKKLSSRQNQVPQQLNPQPIVQQQQYNQQQQQQQPLQWNNIVQQYPLQPGYFPPAYMPVNPQFLQNQFVPNYQNKRDHHFPKHHSHHGQQQHNNKGPHQHGGHHNKKPKKQQSANTVPTGGLHYQNQFPLAEQLQSKPQSISAKEMIDSITKDPSQFDKIVKPALLKVTLEDLQAKYPTQVKELDEVVETLTNPEVLTHVEVVELIFENHNRIQRIQEALELIAESRLEEANAV